MQAKLIKYGREYYTIEGLANLLLAKPGSFLLYREGRMIINGRKRNFAYDIAHFQGDELVLVGITKEEYQLLAKMYPQSAKSYINGEYVTTNN